MNSCGSSGGNLGFKKSPGAIFSDREGARRVSLMDETNKSLSQITVMLIQGRGLFYEFLREVRRESRVKEITANISVQLGEAGLC
jgi:hypothetical protein